MINYTKNQEKRDPKQIHRQIEVKQMSAIYRYSMSMGPDCPVGLSEAGTKLSVEAKGAVAMISIYSSHL